MTSNFEQLQVAEPILKALAEEGYQQPTVIQERSIPIVLSGQDLIGCAQTGTGKTAAFAIPILQRLSDRHTGKRPRKIRALVLSPTRELAIQIAESFSAYGKHLSQKSVVVYGGVPQNPQTRALKDGADILIATPGRLMDLMNQGFISLKDVEIFVLDEADRMLDMGFVHDVKKIVAKLPVKRQTLLFSATMPRAIQQLAATILHQPKQVMVTPAGTSATTIRQSVYHVDQKQKRALLVHLLTTNEVDRVLVFSRTKHGADKLVRSLLKQNISAEAIHGNKTQNARQKALRNFKSHKTRVLIATDIAARGIDIDDLSYVLNFDLSDVPETYVHRIGRTGRAGAEGSAIAFCDASEKSNLNAIQKLIGFKIPIVDDHPFVGIAPVAGNNENAAFHPRPNKRPMNLDAGSRSAGRRVPKRRVVGTQ